MPTATCRICGTEFSAKAARARYCSGGCFRKHEAEGARRRRATWSAERKRAYAVLTTAILQRTIQRRPCEVCGATRQIDAHHDDYSKPLVVRWLCRRHHKLHHNALRRAGAAQPSINAGA